MGQATRTTKLLLDLGKRTQGGTNTSKRAYLEATVELLNAARAFYVAFFLAHADKLSERVSYFSDLSNLSNWHHSGKQKGKPGQPGASNHPTLYEGAFSLELDGLDQRESFVRLKIYTGERWAWVNYPVKYSRYFEQRRTELGWEQQSPKLVLRPKHAELHCSQVKAVKARKINESKQDPHLVTVAVDLNVKNLAVITARQDGAIIETVFVRDHGLDQHRYGHLKRIAQKQWLSGKPVKGEHSNRQLWGHVGRMNEEAAHKVSRSIANVCARYPGCVLLFERLRKIPAKGGSRPGPYADAHTRQGGGAIAGPKGARSSPCALADVTW